MTDEIFRNDGYVFEFEGEVMSVDGEWVELGGTAFYPGGGGQVCDTGTMGGIPVTEVTYRRDNIFHKVPGHQFVVGDRMWCSVDWDRRGAACSVKAALQGDRTNSMEATYTLVIPRPV